LSYPRLLVNISIVSSQRLFAASPLKTTHLELAFATSFPFSSCTSHSM